MSLEKGELRGMNGAIDSAVFWAQLLWGRRWGAVLPL